MSEINITNIVEIVSFGSLLVGVWNRITVKMKEQEMRILALSDRLTKAEQDNNNMYQKLDQIMEMLIEIKVELTKKQDRQ